MHYLPLLFYFVLNLETIIFQFVDSAYPKASADITEDEIMTYAVYYHKIVLEVSR